MMRQRYIWQNADFPNFVWDAGQLLPLLLEVKHAQGVLLGNLQAVGSESERYAACEVLSQDVLRSSEIEGVRVNAKQVRSSVARRLGIEVKEEFFADRDVEGFVSAMFDATQNCGEALSEERLCGWQAEMFPSAVSGLYEIKTGAYRDDLLGAMQVVSGRVGHEKVFFEAPPAKVLKSEMQKLIDFVNFDGRTDNVIKAAVVHLWFVTLHPFDDGNGRIARILSDMLLSRSEGGSRYYSMSAQICRVRANYYEALEITGQLSLDITDWIVWFLENMLHAIDFSRAEFERSAQKLRFLQKHGTVSMNERQSMFVQRLLDGFEGKVTSSKYAKICACSQDSAGRDLTDLAAKGILRREGSGRSVCYLLGE